MNLQMLNAVRATVIVQEATQRKPSDFKGLTFFAASDVWQYHEIRDERICVACRELGRVDQFRGTHLRRYFPWLLITDANRLEANVHPNCRCWLSRMKG